MDSEKLRRHMVDAAAGAAPAKAFNMRLAVDADSAALTGYEHNAVTPVGLATASLPIVLSHRIAALPAFWMGGGEVDLKLAVSTREFVAAYSPIVADVTTGGGEEDET